MKENLKQTGFFHSRRGTRCPLQLRATAPPNPLAELPAERSRSQANPLAELLAEHSRSQANPLAELLAERSRSPAEACVVSVAIGAILTATVFQSKGKKVFLRVPPCPPCLRGDFLFSKRVSRRAPLFFLLYHLPQFIRDLPVICQSWYFVLPAQLSLRFHVINKSIFG